MTRKFWMENMSQSSQSGTKQRVNALKARSEGHTPVLATILVSEIRVSNLRQRKGSLSPVGMESLAIELPASTSTNGLLREIEQLNMNPMCTASSCNIVPLRLTSSLL